MGLYYTYFSDCTKIKVCGYADNQSTHYAGSLVYDNGKFESASFGGGRLVGTNNGTDSEAHYFVTDHLGSTRVVAKVTSAGCEDLDRKDYYPFGKVWQQSGMPASGNRYTFSVKEQQRAGLASTKLLDFGARFYDPDGVTFLQQDPLMEKYYSIGQYNYCMGNPVKYIDPDGQIVLPVGSKEYIASFYSNIKYMQSKGTAAGYNILQKSEKVYLVKEGTGGIKISNNGKNTIFWSPDMALLTTNNKILSPATILAHEFEHGVDAEIDMKQYTEDSKKVDKQYDDKNERKVITNEGQEIAKRHGEIKEGEITRTDHKGSLNKIQYTNPEEIELFIKNYNKIYNEN